VSDVAFVQEHFYDGFESTAVHLPQRRCRRGLQQRAAEMFLWPYWAWVLNSLAVRILQDVVYSEDVKVEVEMLG
jgi:hypothetical protein